MPEWTLTITGCGTSHGNPPWGRPDLWSTDPKDARRRAGAVLHGPDNQILLIDAGPDLAHQLRDPYRNWDGISYPEDCIAHCDGVFITHDHADHSHGLNDLRHVNRLMDGASITVYAHYDHLTLLRSMFPYCFGDGDEHYQMGNPSLLTHSVQDGESFTVAGLRVAGYPVSHGPAGRVTAWKFGKHFGYITDAKTVPAETRAAFRDLDLLVVNMLQEKEHATHMNWQECQELIEDLHPRSVVLTHMGYSVRWQEWQSRLPDFITMAYDGLQRTFQVDEAP